jgi:hypothetical protein
MFGSGAGAILSSIVRRVVSVGMGLEIGGHAGDRVREVAGVEVFERSFSTPVEILVTRQCVSPEASLRIASLKLSPGPRRARSLSRTRGSSGLP